MILKSAPIIAEEMQALWWIKTFIAQQVRETFYMSSPRIGFYPRQTPDASSGKSFLVASVLGEFRSSEAFKIVAERRIIFRMCS